MGHLAQTAPEKERRGPTSCPTQAWLRRAHAMGSCPMPGLESDWTPGNAEGPKRRREFQPTSETENLASHASVQYWEGSFQHRTNHPSLLLHLLLPAQLEMLISKEPRGRTRSSWGFPIHFFGSGSWAVRSRRAEQRFAGVVTTHVTLAWRASNNESTSPSCTFPWRQRTVHPAHFPEEREWGKGHCR